MTKDFPVPAGGYLRGCAGKFRKISVLQKKLASGLDLYYTYNIKENIFFLNIYSHRREIYVMICYMVRIGYYEPAIYSRGIPMTITQYNRFSRVFCLPVGGCILFLILLGLTKIF
jgi:hypothetical protein